MREIFYSSRFKRDYKRVKAGRHGKSIDNLLQGAVDLLADDKPLPPANCDHAMTGEWNDCRDCHLKPDLILVYSKARDGILDLLRLGSHSELGI